MARKKRTNPLSDAVEVAQKHNLKAGKYQGETYVKGALMVLLSNEHDQVSDALQLWKDKYADKAPIRKRRSRKRK